MINRGYTYCAMHFIVSHSSRVYHPGYGMTQSLRGPAIWVLFVLPCCFSTGENCQKVSVQVSGCQGKVPAVILRPELLETLEVIVT